ncbi:LysR substrate-binding domain-containing protein [Streptomyces lydicus]|nr:LysR substrate-binding domain-containing protein [Streptomyces lydicus]
MRRCVPGGWNWRSGWTTRRAARPGRCGGVGAAALGRFSLAVPEGRPPWETRAGSAGAAPVPLAEAAGCDWILPAAGSYYGQAVRAVCRRAGFEPRVAHEVTDTATSLAMVGAGLGVAPLTELMLRLRSAGIVAVPLRESVVRHVVVAVGAEARRRPSVAALIDALREGATP